MIAWVFVRYLSVFYLSFHLSTMHVRVSDAKLQVKKLF